jgi:hypothetical protein
MTRRYATPDYATATNAELAADARRDRDRHYDYALRCERRAVRYEEHAALIEQNAAWLRARPDLAAIIAAEGGAGPEQKDEAAAALRSLAAATRARAPQYRALAREAAARARRHAARAAQQAQH